MTILYYAVSDIAREAVLVLFQVLRLPVKVSQVKMGKVVEALGLIFDLSGA